jgi:hypothetical protein
LGFEVNNAERTQRPGAGEGAGAYIFIYDDESRPQLIDNFRDVAADPRFSLSWFDAMVLTHEGAGNRRRWRRRRWNRSQVSGVRNQEMWGIDFLTPDS